MHLKEPLKTYFGYNEFRPYQEEVVEALCQGQDVMTILPTGSGKSLCYQLPAAILPGTAIVISPLIALMQDQVDSLTQNGIAAISINSSMDRYDIQAVLNSLNTYKLLYIAPERLSDPYFVQTLQESDISFFVIDEAHCISQWGHAFRPEYRQLGRLKTVFQKPISAFTATATRDVAKDIITQLALSNPICIQGSFNRENLFIRIEKRQQLLKQLMPLIAAKRDQSGIIYAGTRKRVDDIHHQLKQASYPVTKYHAGMSDEDRLQSQRLFITDKLPIMVATVAFGMGIHKPDIRYVIHADMPKSLENYYQEIGRAGRDGLPAECHMLYGDQDPMLHLRFLTDINDQTVKRHMQHKINEMATFCTKTSCRRKHLLRYFGEIAEDCGHCDNCCDILEEADITVAAQKILSCVYRLNQQFGISYVIDVLKGSRNKHLLARGHDRLSTYNLLPEYPKNTLKNWVHTLVELGFLRIAGSDYPILALTDRSREVLTGQTTVTVRQRHVQLEESTAHDTHDTTLFDLLRQIRRQLADTENIPPYVIFPDKSLIEMATYYPQSEHSFCMINGVGPQKWQRYGEVFLAVIQGYANAHGHSERTQSPAKDVRKTSSKKISRNDTLVETLGYLRHTTDLDDIAAKRGLSRATIVSHVSKLILLGENLDYRRWVSEEEDILIRNAVTPGMLLGDVKRSLPEHIGYDSIHLVMAAMQTEMM